MRKREAEDRPAMARLAKNSLLVSLGVLMVSLIIMFIIAVMAERGVVGVKVAENSSLVVIIILSLVGSIITIRQQGSMTLIAGLSVSMILLLLLLLLGAISFGGEGEMCVPLLVGVPASGAFAGLLGGKKKKTR